MTARMAFMAFALATPLTGCASLTGASAPSCDGSVRRPLNRSLWDWENARPIAVAPIETLPPASLPPAGNEPIIRKGEVGGSKAHTATLPVFDIAASTRRCGGVDHG